MTAIGKNVDMVSIASWGIFHTAHAGTSPAAPTDEFSLALVDTTDEFLLAMGEPVTYFAIDDLGEVGREILAIVDRQPPAKLEGAPAGKSPLLTISVANRATAIADDSVGGISSTEIDTGGDKVDVVVRIGEASSRRRITGIISPDAGMMKLEVR